MSIAIVAGVFALALGRQLALGWTPSTPPLAKHALLVSSFSDGVVRSADARAFLKLGLAKCFAVEQSRKKEGQVRESVMFSPCQGPAIELLDDLESADNVISSLSDSSRDSSQMDQRASETLQQLTSDAKSCRILYIPTAMYALNPESNNTPGKQRQRARADGKKRRNVVVQEIQNILGGEFEVLACTLDFDDGSIKQPVGSDDPDRFPKNGKDAFSSWRPHLIYVEGGNTFWLFHCLEKGDWSNDLLNACTGPDAYAVYCGKSAGAIIAGARVDTATWKGWDNPAVVPRRESYEDWIEQSGLNFAGDDVSIFPHMDDTWVDLVEKKKGGVSKMGCEAGTVFCLREWEACCIDGESVEVFVVSGDQ